jgi:hypothetical protein
MSTTPKGAVLPTPCRAAVGKKVQRISALPASPNHSGPRVAGGQGATVPTCCIRPTGRWWNRRILCVLPTSVAVASTLKRAGLGRVGEESAKNVGKLQVRGSMSFHGVAVASLRSHASSPHRLGAIFCTGDSSTIAPQTQEKKGRLSDDLFSLFFVGQTVRWSEVQARNCAWSSGLYVIA